MFRLPLVSLALLAARILSPAEAEAGAPAASTDPALDSEVTIETVDGTRTVPERRLAWRFPAAEAPSTWRLGPETVELDAVLFIRFARPSSPSGEIEAHLAGGDILCGRVSDGDEDRVRLRSPALGEEPVAVPLDDLRLLLVREGFGSEAHRLRSLQEWLRTPPPDDRLHLRGERVPVDGIVDSIGGSGVRFTGAGVGALSFPFDRLQAVRLADLGDLPGADPDPEDGPSTPPPAASVVTVVVHTVDGTRLRGAPLGAEDGALTLRHEVLGRLRVRQDAIRLLAFRGGRCQFLSDLDPVRAREHRGALFGGGPSRGGDAPYYAYKRDRSVVGGPLRLGDTVYSKGLGVHSYCRLDYALEGRFRRFRATIGLDASARPEPGAPGSGAAGHVVFRVWLDGEKRLEAAMGPDDAPRDIDLPIRGGKTLGLEVDFGKNDLFLARDRANWAQARILK